MGGGNLSKSVFLRELVAKHHRPGGMPGNLSYDHPVMCLVSRSGVVVGEASSSQSRMYRQKIAATRINPCIFFVLPNNIVLTYISDGTSSDAATRIAPYAFDSIEKGIIWQYKENTRIYSEGERARAKSDKAFLSRCH